MISAAIVIIVSLPVIVSFPGTQREIGIAAAEEKKKCRNQNTEPDRLAGIIERLGSKRMPVRLRTALALREHLRAACSSGVRKRLEAEVELADPLRKVALNHKEHIATRILAVEALSFLAPVSEGVSVFLDDALWVKSPEHPISQGSFAVLEAGKPAAELFAQTLDSDKSRRLRVLAAWYLGRIDVAHDVVAEVLRKAINDTDAVVAAEAASALGNLARRAGKIGAKPEKVVGELVKAAKRRSKTDIPLKALQAIGDIGHATEGGIKLAKDYMRKEGKQGAAAAYALARCRPKESKGLDRLIDLLESESFEESLAALTALGRLGKQATPAVPAIKKCFNSKTIWVLQLKQETLSRIQAGSSEEPKDPAEPSL
jgi:HEAT repeat protein